MTATTTSPGMRQWIGAVLRYRSEHPESLRILDTIERLLDRPYRTHALVRGEPGTGKEGLAKALHAAMHPGDAPFVSIAAAGREARHVADDLFGTAARPGAVERAAGGSVYLDEVATLSGELQARLAAASRGRFTRESDREERRCDVCLLAATDYDVRAMLADGRFKHDLFYRLARIELTVPPLRERPGDIPRAAIWIGNRILERRGEHRRLALESEAEKGDLVLTHDAAQALESQSWMGNFRELDAVMERALMLYGRGDQITDAEIAAALRV